MTQEGQLSDSVKKILAESYVCVYLDSGSTRHAALIASLAVATGKGLVLSDRSGAIQAFHHDGRMAEAELAKQLQHFAQPNLKIDTTLTNASPTISNNPAASSNLRQANYAPAYSTRNC